MNVILLSLVFYYALNRNIMQRTLKVGIIVELSNNELKNIQVLLDSPSGAKPLIPRIRFGTDGIRGILGKDFTIDLFRAAAQAVAQHLKDEPPVGKSGVIVGHDTRFLCRRFAMVVAYELAVAGHDVLLTNDFCATPVIAHYVWRNRLAGGVMLTASHNPPEYQGFKFIPHFGGPALPEDTNRLDEILSDKSQSAENFGEFDPSVMNNISVIDPKPGYIEHLDEMVDFKAIAKSGLKVVYDPMYACGQGSLDGALLHYGFPESNLKVIHTGKDPMFGGSMPDPKGELLDPLRREVASGYNLGFATDGDADRFGAVDAEGCYYSPNVLLFILAHHLIENRSYAGDIARTVATTKLLDRVAESNGRKTIETPVGFKYISEALRDEGAMMGGEESGGFSSAGWVPEKDGIYACLMVLEALAASGHRELGGLLESLYEKYGRLISKRIDLHVSEDEKDALLSAANELGGPFLNEVPVERITIDGVKFVMPSGSSFLLRPSGTEPLIRCYLETPGEESLVSLEAEVRDALGLR